MTPPRLREREIARNNNCDDKASGAGCNLAVEARWCGTSGRSSPARRCPPPLHEPQGLEAGDAVAADDRTALESLLAQGVAGTRAIPGKHGGPLRPMRSVFVSVPDHPGELARLFADAGASEVNIEDVRIDHDPGRPVGLVELVVDKTRAEHLLTSLESRGWVTHR